MPNQSIKEIFNKLKRPSWSLPLNASQEEAMTYFYAGQYDDALQVIENIIQHENLDEIQRNQSLLIKSRILSEKGEKQSALKIAIEVNNKCEEIENPLLHIDSLIAQTVALFQLNEVENTKKLIQEIHTNIKKTRRVSKNEKKLRVSTLYYYQGKINRKKGEFKEATAIFNKALLISEEIGSPYENAILLNELGIINGMKGDYDASIDYFKKSLEMFDKLNNSASIVKLLNNIGQILWQQGDLEQALDYYHRGQELSEKIGQKKLSTIILLNIGLIIEGRGDLDSAFDYFKRSLQNFEELKCQDEIAICLNNMGRVQQIKGELDLALQYYEKSLEILEELDNKHEIAICDSNIGLLYQLKGDYMEAASYLSKTLVIQEELGNPLDLSNTLQNIIENYVHGGSKESADHYLAKLKQIADKEQSKIIAQRYQLCNALVLKMSGRVIHRAEAQSLLTNIANAEVLNHEVSVDAMLNLFELLLFELRTTGNQDVLAEVKALSEKLLTIAKSQQSFTRLAEVYRFQSKLALLELDVKQSQTLLTQAQLIADTKGLHRLARAISNEFDSLLNDLSKWDDYIERNASITERYELAELETMMGAILKKRGSSYDDLPGEDPIMVLILDEAGLCLYSKTFASEETTLQDQLIGGLLTSINAFMQEAFSISGSIERIKHQNNTLLLKNVGPYLFSYVFQGQSYSAIQKLDKFIDNIQDSPLWDDINKIKSTGRTDAVRDALDEAVSLVFA
jgi:tetratricopeptide (TPR) repeat protein